MAKPPDDDELLQDSAEDRFLDTLWSLLEQAQDAAGQPDVMEHLEEIAALCERAAQHARRGP